MGLPLMHPIAVAEVVPRFPFLFVVRDPERGYGSGLKSICEVELCLNPKADPISVRTPPFLADDLSLAGRFGVNKNRNERMIPQVTPHCPAKPEDGILCGLNFAPTLGSRDHSLTDNGEHDEHLISWSRKLRAISRQNPETTARRAGFPIDNLNRAIELVCHECHDFQYYGNSVNMVHVEIRGFGERSDLSMRGQIPIFYFFLADGR